MTSISGRDPLTGRTIEVVIRDGIIAAINDIRSEDPAWLSPGLIDLQINGYQGFDLNSDNLTPDIVVDLAYSVLATGVTTFLPTIITASEEKIIACLRAIAAARQLTPALQHMIPGVHVEGPHLSPEDGPRGAHPREHIRPPSIAEFDRWQQASGDLVKLVTLSPHFHEAPHYIAALHNRGILVSIGHTHASIEQIHAAVNAGATLSTHLGNGVAYSLPRHPNLLWTQLADDRLTGMFIGDGHHVPDDTLKVMLRAKSLDRAILTSDLVALGGKPPGLYETPVGGLVELSPDGRLSLSGTDFLAGSVVPLKDAVAHLAATYLSLSESLQLATQNPARVLGRISKLQVGAPGNLIRFTWERAAGIQIESVLLQGSPAGRRE
ncbi:N-acetylglucosamine-6-phosphate deacetylase [Edaphobacter modestus]|uniref:N-acetylglucosamine-6-phosphate deacetylase n=1 Tax=Edaphobacter modestus TaxID=388466 RepID=A0A4Q7YS10_9BACT|nr:amidohydrolase family protein [Edaphobacter modestus]RZU39713.1 N-acetylglucosamine-6-phosphate deacetylase [Edaphobacter modestus]